MLKIMKTISPQRKPPGQQLSQKALSIHSLWHQTNAWLPPSSCMKPFSFAEEASSPGHLVSSLKQEGQDQEQKEPRSRLKETLSRISPLLSFSFKIFRPLQWHKLCDLLTADLRRLSSGMWQDISPQASAVSANADDFSGSAVGSADWTALEDGGVSPAREKDRYA